MNSQDRDGVDAHVEAHISTIKNHAQGNDTIQFMPSTDGLPLNGTNNGVGDRLKQAGGFFNDESLQQLSRDFTTIAAHQSGRKSDADTSVSIPNDKGASADPKSPFGDRHGPGFMLAKRSSPPSSHPEP
ncbi:hypothetical protein HJFPF1_13505 [Paramyrothecium foliicola]|nr:hypothetical protein HJFPF1_13505 [Paramyrothecium foliicola]